MTLQAISARDYRHRAERYRPTDPVAIAVEVRRLAASGLTARDIGTALGIQTQTISEALRDS